MIGKYKLNVNGCDVRNALCDMDGTPRAVNYIGGQRVRVGLCRKRLRDGLTDVDM